MLAGADFVHVVITCPCWGNGSQHSSETFSSKLPAVKLEHMIVCAVRLPYARNSMSSRVARWRCTKRVKNTQGTLDSLFTRGVHQGWVRV